MTICGSNVNDYHVFQGWCLGRTMCRNDYDTDPCAADFDRRVVEYCYYSSPEMLRYPVFYVRQEVMATR